ncbi:MAG TPA: HlyD family type I secretion periplasmic adaptor subunit [Alphaproteobacteria bacterium]|nr:HlyD family type I secretion periplasmic adaptor subunit [Alphaproteobacteria bacterium]
MSDTDFMEELEAATRLRPSESSHMMLIAIASLIAAFIIWSSFSEIEEITHGTGQVVPTQEIQVVQSLEGGILSELLVREGDQVKKDQILLKVSDVAFASEERGVEAKSLSLKAKKARLEAEAQGKQLELPQEIIEKFPDIARNEEALYRSRQQELSNAKAILDNKINSAQAELSEVRAKINRLSESRKLLNQELSITKEMVAKKAVPKLEEIRLNRELADISGQIREASEKKGGLEAELRGAEKERKDREDKFKSQVLGELNDIESQISQIGESLTAIGDRVSRTEIRSPVDGIVNKIMIKTIGGVIEPAMQLVEIVPLDDDLKIVARVTPQEIAFLRPGQDVNIKISAYDPQRYGSLKGKLIRIGANSGADREGNVFFEIEVEANKNYLGTKENPLPITPGMVAQTEIITGKRTILSYLMKPVLRTRDKAFTER